MRNPFRKPAPPRTDAKVKITAGSGLGHIKVLIDGVDMSDHLLSRPFKIHFANEDDPETYLVIGLPVSELDIEMTDAAIHAIACDEITGEVA